MFASLQKNNEFTKDTTIILSVETLLFTGFASYSQEIPVRPRICVNHFLSFPQKNLSPEKTETNEVFTFQFFSDELTKTPVFPNCQVPIGFLWYNCKCNHSKIKKQALSFSQFSLGTGFFEGMRENVSHIFQACKSGGKKVCSACYVPQHVRKLTY